jgi:hypothetical protein
MNETDQSRLLSTLAILRDHTEPNWLPAPSPTLHNTVMQQCAYISPFYAPYNNLEPLRSHCTTHTFEIIKAMYTLTQAALSGNRNLEHPIHQQHIYNRLLQRPPPQYQQARDWIHETIRLAALLHTHSLLNGTSLAAAGNTPYPSANGSSSSTTLLLALHNAIDRTNPSDCWATTPLRGIFLWTCLVGGAASRPTLETHQIAPGMAWARRSFSLWAIKAVMAAGFDHADVVREMLGNGVKIGRVDL